MPNVSRGVLDALLPGGSLWNPEKDQGFDQLLDGMAENSEIVAEALACLSCVRDPHKTTLLDDLEKEYGITTNENLTEETRRMQLAALVYFADVAGTPDTLETALNNAGFPVQVHENSPAVDPDVFLNSIPFMVADGDNAYAGFFPTTPGEYTSIAGKTGGDLLVNGDLFIQRPEYISVAGEIYAGEPTEAFAGLYNNLIQEPIVYEIPDDPDTWPFFFFVGGDATRNMAGELTNIETVDIPQEQKSVFETLILKYKPLHTWAGLIINYT